MCVYIFVWRHTVCFTSLRRDIIFVLRKQDFFRHNVLSETFFCPSQRQNFFSFKWIFQSYYWKDIRRKIFNSVFLFVIFYWHEFVATIIWMNLKWKLWNWLSTLFWAVHVHVLYFMVKYGMEHNSQRTNKQTNIQSEEEVALLHVLIGDQFCQIISIRKHIMTYPWLPVPKLIMTY